MVEQSRETLAAHRSGERVETKLLDEIERGSESSTRRGSSSSPVCTT